MHQPTNEATTVQPSAKQAWATPAIETYDVAEFTLGNGSVGNDAANSVS